MDKMYLKELLNIVADWVEDKTYNGFEYTFLIPPPGVAIDLSSKESAIEQHRNNPSIHLVNLDIAGHRKVSNGYYVAFTVDESYAKNKSIRIPDRVNFIIWATVRQILKQFNESHHPHYFIFEGTETTEKFYAGGAGQKLADYLGLEYKHRGDNFYLINPDVEPIYINPEDADDTEVNPSTSSSQSVGSPFNLDDDFVSLKRRGRDE